ncbi:MAG: TonB-dependent receptor [Myxococcota bacterium]|nr:TonB-dependent receptor [Myxococcota bacterium]
MSPISPILLLSLALAQEDTGASDGAASDGGGEAGGVIEVHGERSEQADPQRSAAPVTVIQVDERLPSSWDVAQVVDSASGTTVNRLGGLGDYATVSIRGSSSRQVQIHLDGIPLNPDGSAAVNLSELPLHSFERVEIYRGNPPPQLGAAPIGGVVNLVPGDARGTQVHGSVGSFGYRKAGASHAGQLGQTRVLVLGEAFHSDGDFSYFDDGGTRYTLMDDRLQVRQNNDSDQISGLLRLERPVGPAELSLLWAPMLREEGLAGHSGARSYQTRLDSRRNLVGLQAQAGTGQLSLSARAWHQLRVETLDDPLGEIVLGAREQRTSTQQLGTLASVAWAPSPSVILRGTAWGRLDQASAQDLMDPGAKAEQHLRWTTGAAASADLWLLKERLRVSPVLQGLWVDSASVSSLAAFTPRIGVAALPVQGVILKASAGRYLRPPDFGELYGDRGVLVGNPDLSPESGWQADVGARLQSPQSWGIQGSLELGHYWRNSENLITWSQNSQKTLVAHNVGRAWVQGVEAALSAELHGWVSLQSNLTRTLSVNLTADPAVADNQLPRIPLWELSQVSSVHWGERVRLGHTWSYSAQSYWDRTNWYLVPPRSLHGVFLRVQPKPALPSLELSVLNLRDQRVEAVARNVLDPQDDNLILQPLTDFVGYPLPGRTVLLTLRWSPSPETP